jgi:hypothetical protein
MTASLNHIPCLGLLTLMLIGAKVSAYEIDPPIPVVVPEPGIRYNPFGIFRPTVRLEIFLELNCGDSAEAWPIVKRVADYYGNTRFDLVVQQLPLPYHRNAMLSTQGLYVIEEETPFRVFNFLEAMLARTDEFSTAATVDLSENEVLEMLADVAVASTEIDRDLFKTRIASFRPKTAWAWKYAMRRQQSGTPSFFLNGVDLSVTEIPTFEEWIEFIDPIIAAAEARQV